MSLTGPATILGGLPIIAEVTGGYDSFTGEYWSEVEAIYWMKRDRSKGKPIPQHLRDKAEKADPYFATVTEQVFDYHACGGDDGPEDVMVPFEEPVS